MRTNAGALTTAFIPPAACSTYFVQSAAWYNSASSFSKRYGAFACTTFIGNSLRSLGYADGTSCMPQGLESILRTPGSNTHSVVFSPGLVCPYGWSAACTMTRFVGDDPKTIMVIPDRMRWSLLNDNEALTACCPSGYQCHNFWGELCTSTIKGGDVIAGSTFDENCSKYLTSFTLPADIDTTSIVAQDLGILLVRSLDPSETTRPPQPPSTGTASSNTGGLGSTKTNNNQGLNTITPNSDGGDGSGLSSGAKIGIGVGVALGVVISVVVAFFIIRRRWPKKPPILDDPGYSKPELDSTAIAVQKHELSANRVDAIEMETRRSDPSQRPVELGGEFNYVPGVALTQELQGSVPVFAELGTAEHARPGYDGQSLVAKGSVTTEKSR